MPGQQFALARLHRLGFLVDLVVPAEEVQHTVNDEQGDLRLLGHPVFDGVARGDGGTDDDVADQRRDLG